MGKLICPLCESEVRASHVKPLTRLLCNKCHSDFYVNWQGRTILGEPPDAAVGAEELKLKLEQGLGRFLTVKSALGAAALLVLGVGLYNLFGPAEHLDRAAAKAARALLKNDPASLKALAAPGTADDVGRWYEAVRPDLERARGQWVGKEEVAETLVAQEDRDQHKGAVGVSIHPAASGARDVSLANPAEATAAPKMPFEVATDWTLTRWGRWKIDGRSTLARVRKVTGPP